MWKNTLKRTAFAAAGITVLVAIALTLLWRDRPSLEAIGWPAPMPASAVAPGTVTVTWLGVTTLLFDDGETQLLIDGFISRPTLADIALRRPVNNDAAQINHVLNEFRMRRLAAIIPVHSHFDHAMDVGAIANRSSASVVGSESTAQIARGAGVPDDQLLVVGDAASYQFGQFKVALIRTPHAPLGWRGSVPYDGTIDAPLKTPQPISSWRMGGSYSIVIAHPQGTTLVQGSAGFLNETLQDVSVDVVMLGVARLGSLGKEYAESYWQHTVTTTGGRSVYPIHFDDYTKPFGDITLQPNFIGNFVTTAKWLEEFRDRWDNDTALFMPTFGEPIALYAQSDTES